MEQMQQTPLSSRLHIGIFGRRNAGKSSLINALTGQQTSLVSDVPGTTADPVCKAIELHGFGPVVFVDTAGFDDEGPLGKLRVERTREAVKRTDVAVLVFDAMPTDEEQWVRLFAQNKTPLLYVINKADTLSDTAEISAAIKERFGGDALPVSARTGQNIDRLRRDIARLAPDDFWDLSITGELVREGDLVLLVMPQDIEAPKGRLILPQVQTLRELLDKKCAIMSCTADKMAETLAYLAKPPKLIITDSQAFASVYPLKPSESLLTSFSILFAGYKGDINAFMEGAKAIDALTESSRVLVAEACAHAPVGEDIGRVKIPALLRKRVGQGLSFTFVRGGDFPEDLSPYDLIIHCGACMFNRRHVLSRIEEARSQGVPICNYGVVIAYLTGILDKVVHA